MPTDPVELIETDDPRPPEPGTALCLSGGGYRAMVFHIGVLWRLYEAGFSGLKRISSVSGGSITAGLLGLKWSELSFDPARSPDRFRAEGRRAAAPLAGETIDADAVIFGVLAARQRQRPRRRRLRRHLFDGATLQDLPDEPRFVINATNVQSGALWRFMKPYMRDYRVGEVKKPTVPLAQAVAASSAFPPVLSPFELRLDRTTTSRPARARSAAPALHQPGGPHRRRRLRQSRPGDRMEAVPDRAGQRCRRQAQAEEEPKTDWARHSYRVLD